jgi:hypothetical protein
MTAFLHAVRHPHRLTVSEALAWFTEHTDDHDVIGYLLAPDRAEWFRCAGPVPHGPSGPRDLTAVFELFATAAGRRQLRWLHTASGAGSAVSLAEDPDLLPAGIAVGTQPLPARLEGVATRLLAGLVTRSHDGWATLSTARYAPAEVPVTAARDQEVCAELAEYVITDEHGNLSVTDTLLLGLRPRNSCRPKTQTAPERQS